MHDEKTSVSLPIIITLIILFIVVLVSGEGSQLYSNFSGTNLYDSTNVEIKYLEARYKLVRAEEKNVPWSGENSDGEKVTFYRDKGFVSANYEVGRLSLISAEMKHIYNVTDDIRFLYLSNLFNTMSEGIAKSNYEDVDPYNFVPSIAAAFIREFMPIILYT